MTSSNIAYKPEVFDPDLGKYRFGFIDYSYPRTLRDRILDEWKSGQDWELESILEDLVDELTAEGEFTQGEAVKLICMADKRFAKFFPISGRDWR